jgi:hypothetical protein
MLHEIILRINAEKGYGSVLDYQIHDAALTIRVSLEGHLSRLGLKSAEDYFSQMESADKALANPQPSPASIAIGYQHFALITAGFAVESLAEFYHYAGHDEFIEYEGAARTFILASCLSELGSNLGLSVDHYCTGAMRDKAPSLSQMKAEQSRLGGIGKAKKNELAKAHLREVVAENPGASNVSLAAEHLDNVQLKLGANTLAPTNAQRTIAEWIAEIRKE